MVLDSTREENSHLGQPHINLKEKAYNGACGERFE